VLSKPACNASFLGPRLENLINYEAAQSGLVSTGYIVNSKGLAAFHDRRNCLARKACLLYFSLVFLMKVD
jgi:hypothetical protein